MNILIIGYRRIPAIARLLSRIKEYDLCPKNIFLCIDGPADKDHVRNVLKEHFQHLNIEVVTQEINLGLKEHVIFACDLASQYGDFIVLEEDCDISPSILEFAASAVDFYRHDAKIAGVSLYRYSNIEMSNTRFTPINDGADVFFMKVPSSSGQCWTNEQWGLFKSWLHLNDDRLDVMYENIPKKVAEWPNNSWKKMFWAYIADTNKYFVYPYVSLSTNVSDGGGENIPNSTSYFQVPLMYGTKADYNFTSFDQSKICYDQFFELEALKDPSLYGLPSHSKIAINLHGLRTLDKPEYDYILGYGGLSPFKTFGLSYKPVELNVLMGHHGDVITLSQEVTGQYYDFEYLTGLKFHNKNFLMWLLKTLFEKLKVILRVKV